MIVESLAILLILLAMEFFLLRAHHTDHALHIMPVLILPAGHLVANLLPDFIPFLTLSFEIKCLVDIILMMVAVCMMGFFAANFKRRKAKVGYFVLCGGFTLILGMIFLANIYSSAV